MSNITLGGEIGLLGHLCQLLVLELKIWGLITHLLATLFNEMAFL